MGEEREVGTGGGVGSHTHSLTVVLKHFDSGSGESGSSDNGGVVEFVAHNQTSLQVKKPTH